MNDQERAVMQQALEALEHIEHYYISLPKAGNKAITALRAALAQQEDIAQNLQSRLDAALLLEARRQEVAQPHRGLAEEAE